MGLSSRDHVPTPAEILSALSECVKNSTAAYLDLKSQIYDACMYIHICPVGGVGSSATDELEYGIGILAGR